MCPMATKVYKEMKDVITLVGFHRTQIFVKDIIFKMNKSAELAHFVRIIFCPRMAGKNFFYSFLRFVKGKEAVL